MIIMVCPECKSENKHFNERLGESVCDECGLVIVTEPFEQTVLLVQDGHVIHSIDNGVVGTTNDIPRHIKKGIHFCNMALNAIAPQLNLKDRVAKVYVDAHNKNLLTSKSLEDRASAVVYYVLKENNTPFTMHEVCSEYSSNPKIVRNIVRRINQVYGNRNCSIVNHDFSLGKELNKFNLGLEFENACKKVLTKLETDFDEQYFVRGKAYYATICWFASLLLNSPLSQKEISEKTGVPAQTIKVKGNELCVLLGFKETKQMKGKINEV